jgi:DNA-binding NarL/FixJ family response regulator
MDQVMTYIATDKTPPTSTKRRKAAPDEMAVRIKEIARLRAAGYRNAEIANALDITKKTVEMNVHKYEITKDGRILDPEGTSHLRPSWQPRS